MSSDDTTWQDGGHGNAAPGLRAARAQIEAARMRQQGLIASGRLTLGEPVPTKKLPGYTLLREIHRGGQGVVYLAIQESTGRRVAIKLLRSWHCSGMAGLARFDREVEILSGLKHPNIVTIHDCGRDHEDVYLVMDFVDGCGLDIYVSREKLSLRDTLTLFTKVCDGVNAAHLRGVIHRDLKPGNIMVDTGGEPRLLDFGLAKLENDSRVSASTMGMTIPGQFVGSMPWASPEQAEGRSEQLDVRSDVYSLGVVLYQLLTGRFPYVVTGRIDEVVWQIVHANPARPSLAQPAIDRELETLLLKCLAKEPERRYQSAGELARDIRRYLAGEPIEARRDSIAYVMTKQLARYRVAAIASAVVLLAVSGALIVSTISWRQAVHQRLLAQESAAAAQESAERADREADQARAAFDFMREVLTSVDPENQGADVRLLDVLTNASAIASERFADHPIQEALVRELLGQVYLNLSFWAESEKENLAAFALWRQNAGPDDPRTLRAESNCVGVALNLSRFSEAESKLTELLPRMTRVLGPDDRTTLAARRSLAIAHLQQGHLDEAEPILLELRAHPAITNDDAMQLRVAQTLIDLLQWRRTGMQNGPERNASLAQEESLAREWHERAVRVYGANSSIAQQARAILADIACDQGEYQDSANQCRALLADTEGRLPDCHDLRSWTISVLANALGHLGEANEAADLYMRRIACLRQAGPSARISLISAISDSLAFFERAGRAAEGETLARELAEVMGKYGGVMAFDADLYLARFASMQSRFDDAETFFASLLDREKDNSSPTSRARLHLFYGGQHMLRGRFEDAERELQKSAEILGDVRIGTRESHPDDLVGGFIALYDAWGKPDKAADYRQIRDEMTKSH